MSLTTGSIPALYNGVSQQPAAVRHPSQGEAQVNALPSVATGLRKRPPTQHVANLSAFNWSSAFMHEINRDVTERYTVVCDGTSIFVYDQAGVAQTVNYPEGTTYLGVVGGVPAKDAYRAVTVADYTFFVNRTKTVAMDSLGTEHNLPAGWANYRTVRDIGVDLDLPYRSAGATNTYKGVKQTTADLPKAADNPIEGDVWKVSGLDTEAAGAFWVRRTGGEWQEAVEPGLYNRFDDDTMPWALVRESDGEFYFRPFKWAVRRVGDDTSNPYPSFVGRTIRDIFFYKNRLGIVTDENVVFSGAGEFGNFWRNTVQQILASDVVDVAHTATNVAKIEYAVPFKNTLMLFADQTQFALNVDQWLTPSTVSIDPVTNYEMSLKVRPVGLGDDVYFVTEVGNYSRVMEYYVSQGDSLSAEAADVTAHVPKYLPKNITHLTGNTDLGMLFALSSDHPNRVYVYNFEWQGDEKVQSAWGYWEHGDSNVAIHAISVVKNKLHLITDYTLETNLEVVDLEDGLTTGALSFEVLLDRAAEVTGVYTTSTAFVLPYPVEAADRANFKIVRGGDFAVPGSLIDPSTYVWGDDSNVSVPGDESAGECHIGLTYTFSYTFSRQFKRRSNGVAITSGRLQLRTFRLSFEDTGYFKTIVAPYGTGSEVTEEIVPSGFTTFTGKELGSANLQLDTPSFEEGEYEFQIYGDSRHAIVTIENDTYVQSQFGSVEWEGFYHNRAN